MILFTRGLRKYYRHTNGFLQPEITIETSTCVSIISTGQFRSNLFERNVFSIITIRSYEKFMEVSFHKPI